MESVIHEVIKNGAFEKCNIIVVLMLLDELSRKYDEKYIRTLPRLAWSILESSNTKINNIDIRRMMNKIAYFTKHIIINNAHAHKMAVHNFRVNIYWTQNVPWFRHLTILTSTHHA